MTVIEYTEHTGPIHFHSTMSNNFYSDVLSRASHVLREAAASNNVQSILPWLLILGLTLGMILLICFLLYPAWETALRQEVSAEMHTFTSKSKDRTDPLSSIDEGEDVLLSLIIPAYNEQDRLVPMLEAAETYLHQTNCPARDMLAKAATHTHTPQSSIIEWIVVDDGSRDNTCQVYESYVQKQIQTTQQSTSTNDDDDDSIMRWRLCKLAHNSGKGAAVKAGMSKARGKFCLMVDADGATDFGPGLEALAHHASTHPFIFGSRASAQNEESAVQRSWIRRFLQACFHAFVVLVVGNSSVQDTQCGFKLFRGEVVGPLFGGLHLHKWSFDIELFVRAGSLNLSLQEVPVPWQEIEGSKLNTSTFNLLRVAVGMLRDMICVRLCYTLGIWRVETRIPNQSTPTSSSSLSAQLDSLQSWTVQYLFPPLFLCWRIAAANRLPITDCDEVYNYWEPLHFVLFGTGLQTWEYATEFALRTYTYLLPLQGLARFFSTVLNNESLAYLASLLMDQPSASETLPQSLPPRLALFILLRAAMAAVMAMTEVIWLQRVVQRQWSQGHAFWTGWLLLTAAGMNHAAAAFLPSATWMMGWMMAQIVSTSLGRRSINDPEDDLNAEASMEKEIQQTIAADDKAEKRTKRQQKPHSSLTIPPDSSSFSYRRFCILAITATLTIGWPFGVVLLVPQGIEILCRAYQKSLRTLINVLLFAVMVTVIVQAFVLWIDRQQYGRWTSATLNIFLYNAAGNGDELYGVEPLSYYIKNLFLNWNYVGFLAFPVLPLVIFTQKFQWHAVVTILPLYLWMAITFPRPHKEERFLFPMYPLLALGGVHMVDTMLNALGRARAAVSRRKSLTTVWRFVAHAVVWSGAMLWGISRTYALSFYYTAPLHLYAHWATMMHNERLSKSGADGIAAEYPALVCTCGEW